MHTRVCVHKFDVCIRIHEPTYAAKVLESYDMEVFCIKVEV